jgi:hypothetical protein
LAACEAWYSASTSPCLKGSRLQQLTDVWRRIQEGVYFSGGRPLLKRLSQQDACMHQISYQQNLQTAQGSTNSTSHFSVIADLMMALAGLCNPKPRGCCSASQRVSGISCARSRLQGTIARALAVEDAFSVANDCSCCILPGVGC